MGKQSLSGYPNRIRYFCVANMCNRVFPVLHQCCTILLSSMYSVNTLSTSKVL